MTTQDWACDRQRFVVDARDAEQAGVLPTRDHGFPLGPLGREFAALTLALLDAQNVEEVLEQVVRATARVASQADLISVTLRTPDGRFHSPVATGWTGRILDELQYEFGEGPCVTAAEDPGPGFAAWSDFSRTDSPWPRFSSAANKMGIGSVLSFSLLPAPVAPRLSGALNLYARSAGVLDQLDRDVILLLATHASLALATTEAVTSSNLRDSQLHRAIDSRDVIGQAKGILMSRRGISAGTAFDTLRNASQRLNVKLTEIAEAIVAHPDVLD